MEDFYVYELIDSDTQQPFYIGKGTGKRTQTYSTELLTGVSKTTKIAIMEMRLGGKEPEVRIVKDEISEIDAVELESALIKKYGRKGKDIGGILTNVLLRGHLQSNGQSKKYKTVQIEASVKDRLTEAIKPKGWSISFFVESLIEKYLDGSITGSFGSTNEAIFKNE